MFEDQALYVLGVVLYLLLKSEIPNLVKLYRKGKRVAQNRAWQRQKRVEARITDMIQDALKKD